MIIVNLPKKKLSWVSYSLSGNLVRSTISYITFGYSTLVGLKIVLEPDRDNEDVRIRADFETAISVSGFGWHSILLLFAVFVLSLGITFQMSAIPYALYRAECDLDLTLIDKGVLSAMSYAGMSTSCLLWNYISNVNGRQNVLVYGSFLAAVSMLGSASSQNVISLIVFQYVGGFAISGPTSAIISYQAEMCSKRYRNTMTNLRAAMFATSSVVLILSSMIILPKTWNIQLISWNFHSWQIFIAVGAVPLLLSAFLFRLLPESPKFLMSQGQNAKALEIFRTIYKFNKCKSRNNYPIKELQLEMQQNANELETKNTPHRRAQETVLQYLHKTIKQFRPLLHKPYRSLAIITILQSFFISLVLHVLRLWLPQIFSSFEEYYQLHDDASNMRLALEHIANKTEGGLSSAADYCDEVIGISAYKNNMIMGAGNFLIFIIANVLAKYFNLKYILIFGSILAGCASVCLIWSVGQVMTLMLSTQVIANASFALAALLNAKSTLFPTAQRSIILSCSCVFEFLGAVIGGILFSVLLSVDYLAPFLLLSSVLFFTSVLGIFLPSMKRGS